METLFSIPAIFLYAALYGVTMKVADLLNEHGLRLFKYADIIFGFLWGMFGAILIITTTPIVGSVILAMNIAFLVRSRLDYLNHQIAAAIITVAAVLFLQTLVIPFIIFLSIFLVFGSLKDYADDIWHLKGFLSRLTEWSLYYPIPTFIYGLMTGDWMVFYILTLYIVAYNITKSIARNYGYK